MAKLEENSSVIRELYTDLLCRWGSLHAHLSGEGILSFQDGKSPGVRGFIQTSFDGEQGCMSPVSEDFDDCAKLSAFTWLRSLVPVPHLALAGTEEMVLSEEEWIEEMIKFENAVDLDLGKKEHWHVVSRVSESTGKLINIATIRLTPVCNSFVSGAWLASAGTEFIGIIDDYADDRAKIFAISQWDTSVRCGDDVLNLSHKNTQVFSPTKYPAIGDVVLYDTERKVYIVMDEHDYIPGR